MHGLMDAYETMDYAKADAAATDIPMTLDEADVEKDGPSPDVLGQVDADVWSTPSRLASSNLSQAQCRQGVRYGVQDSLGAQDAQLEQRLAVCVMTATTNCALQTRTRCCARPRVGVSTACRQPSSIYLANNLDDASNNSASYAVQVARLETNCMG